MLCYLPRAESGMAGKVEVLMRKSSRTGFTLIELLVVIAIISILASILFPVFARARAKGRQAACISNVRQICLAIAMYSQDYDEIVVRGDADGNAATVDDQWYNATFPYTRNRQIMFCPDRKDKGPGYGLSYYASCRAVGNFWDAASKIVIADSPPECLGSNGTVAANGRWWANPPTFTAAANNSFRANNYPQRHNDGLVFGYADGHCKWGREEQVDNDIYWVPDVPTE